jgi:3-phenylpropionate/cinnamic acid dioxygenase small subunit
MALNFSADVQGYYQEAVHFLLNEAEILDAGDYKEWLNCLTDDVIYQIPVRVTRERNAATSFSNTAWHMNEDRASLEMRIARTYTEYNWSEDPASRTRHFLTNFRLAEASSEGENTEVKLKSNLLLYRSKFDQTSYHLISAERQDTLRKIGDEWKICRRLVLLDHTTMGFGGLAIFL